MRNKFYLLIIGFLSSCAVSNKLTKRTFSSFDEMLFFIKEDFKNDLNDIKDTVYYFPPVISDTTGDTAIVMFRSNKLTIMNEEGFYISRKNRVLGDTTIFISTSKSQIFYKRYRTEYYIDRKKLKMLYVKESLR